MCALQSLYRLARPQPAGFVDSISTRSRRRRPKRATSTSAAAGQHARVQDLPLMRRTPPPPFISSSGSLSPCIQVRPHFGRRSAIELKALHNSRWRTGSKLMCSCTYFLILKLEIVICKISSLRQMCNVLHNFHCRRITNGFCSTLATYCLRATAKRSTKSDVCARQQLESELESPKQGGNQKQVANLRLPG
ncbi:hypothetical protein PVAP13_8KG379504 [Panicum virgatum]|uniref:Uncharacterized protein n=1 Tax=Panicum virgatum TaxID=38727 RepID=A0A8T0PSW0_PANVG|nr:hypothetical protein PVAP13_8KG379504 [Panicum virgatum]